MNLNVSYISGRLQLVLAKNKGLERIFDLRVRKYQAEGTLHNEKLYN
jgi:hypothetical protein